MQTTGRYSTIPNPLSRQNSANWDGSDATDELRSQRSVNMAEDDRSWAARLFDRGQERFSNNPKLFAAALFIPAATAFAGGIYALHDDPDDKVTAGLVFATGGLLTVFAALGVLFCRRASPRLA